MNRRKVIIDGDEYEVMDEGNCFIETKRKRYSWREGELKLFEVREKLGKPGKDGKRKPELVGWGYARFTGRDILELYGPEYDKGRGHECWIRFAGVDQPEKLPAPKIEVIEPSGLSKDDVKSVVQKAVRKRNRNRGPLGRKSAVDKPRWEAAMKKMHTLVVGGKTHEAAAEEVKASMKLDVKAGTIKRRYAAWLKAKVKRT